MSQDIITSHFDQDWKKRGKKMKKSRIFWGVLFIAFAVLLITSQLGILKIQISVWTLMLTVFFGVYGFWSLFHKEAAGFLFSLAFLVIIYDEPLGLQAITPWTVLLAALFASIGWYILFPTSKKKTHVYQDKKNIKEHDIRIEENFGSCIRYVNAQNIENVEIINRAGMVKVFFQEAGMKEMNADFYLHVFCGMVEICVPRTWRIIDETENFLSYVSIEEGNSNIIEHTILLKGRVNLSEVKVSYL